MNFEDTLEYMYRLLPMYQRIGAVAFKKDLTNTFKLCEALGNPQNSFKSVHIAGTNGKGSSAHMLASIMQSAGYKTGLYTSPHLKSFTERIKVNGIEVKEQFVCSFIDSIREQIEKIQPSFFEITVAMAFDYFAKQKVDIAVIEVGLGGRFDSTNIITPLVSLITSIGLDHTDMLGETLPEIAFEKAGIIKEDAPVVISETQPEIIHVFRKKANEMNAPLIFADENYEINAVGNSSEGQIILVKSPHESKTITCDLQGTYQTINIGGVLSVLDILNKKGFQITDKQVSSGLGNVVLNTGLKGRWQKIGNNPLMICDTVHNESGVSLVINQLGKLDYNKLFIIWGAVSGKKLDNVLKCLPKDAFYYFCEPKIERALKADVLKQMAMTFQLEGEVIQDVNNAIEAARSKATKGDLIFIGGSNFIVAEIKDL